MGEIGSIICCGTWPGLLRRVPYHMVSVNRMEYTRKNPARRSQTAIHAVLLFAFLAFILATTPVSADLGSPDQPYAVLVLNSYHPEFIWTKSQSDGIIQTLRDSGLNMDISVEYLDWKNHPDPQNLEYLARIYQNKYRDHPFDVILVTDDLALTFVIDHRGDVFGDVPVVFCGVNNFDQVPEAGRKNVTGKIQEMSPEKTIASIFMLFPSTESVTIFYEDTETGRGIADRIQRAAGTFSGRAEFTYITNITFEEMTAQARALPAGSAILSAITRDSTGRVMDHEDVAALLSREADVPVFALYDLMVGHGAIGGSVVSSAKESQIAGDMAVRILQGVPVESLPVDFHDATVYYFDQTGLDRFGVAADHLPAGSTVINRHLGILDEYFWEVVVAALIILILLTCIIILTINIRIRKHAEAELRQNIDKRIRAEQELRVSQERYHQLFESSPVSLFEEDLSACKKIFDELRTTGVDNFRAYFETHPASVQECAQHIRVLDVNDATIALMGAENKNELIASPNRIFTAEALETFSEELIRLAEGSLQFAGEFAQVTLKGQRISVILNLTVAPGYEKTLGRVLVSLLDITDRKIAEENLHQQYRFLQELMDTIPNPVFFRDTHGRYLGSNRAFAEMIGRTGEEITGKTIRDLWPEDLAAIYEEHDTALFASPGVQVFESNLRDRDGILRTVLFNKATFHGPEGKINGLIGVIVDITERKRTENGLHQATKKLNLLTQVTHTDIQNAIFSLAGYIDLVRRGCPDPGVQHYLDKQAIIVKSISELLIFARNYQDLGLRPPVWQNVKQVFILAISHIDISRIQRNLQVDRLAVYADPLLENAFFTLVENSLLHGNTVHEISLRYVQETESLTLIYEDDGEGVRPEMKERIFERRFEEKKGLGLYLTREILGITGISIHETGDFGRGARFEIIIPKGNFRFTNRDATGDDTRDSR